MWTLDAKTFGLIKELNYTTATTAIATSGITTVSNALPTNITTESNVDSSAVA